MASFSTGDLASVVLAQIVDKGSPLDLTGATASFVVTQPDGSVVTWAATVLPLGTYTYGNLTLSTTGHEGWLQYVTSAVGAGDFVLAGEYRVRVKVVGLGAWSGRSIGGFGFVVAA